MTKSPQKPVRIQVFRAFGLNAGPAGLYEKDNPALMKDGTVRIGCLMIMDNFD